MSKAKCLDWQHTWVTSTSNIYEICQICKAVRKKPTHVLPVIEKKGSENPCVLLYGEDSEGHTCGTCIHLLGLLHHDKRYLKCELRQLTHGAGSDHRAKWEACGKYEPKKEGQEHESQPTENGRAE